MKLAVIGSSTFNNSQQLRKYLSIKKYISEIITGNAEGADQLAQTYAKEQGISLRVLPFQKELITNECDAIIAFWDGKSEGTQEVLKLARKKGKKIEVVFLEKRSSEPEFGYISL